MAIHYDHVDQETTYEGELAKSHEWQEKANHATTAALKSAFEAVAREYVHRAALIRMQQGIH
jgi:hypothetical protein